MESTARELRRFVYFASQRYERFYRTYRNARWINFSLEIPETIVFCLEIDVFVSSIDPTGKKKEITSVWIFDTVFSALTEF